MLIKKQPFLRIKKKVILYRGYEEAKGVQHDLHMLAISIVHRQSTPFEHLDIFKYCHDHNSIYLFY